MTPTWAAYIAALVAGVVLVPFLGVLRGGARASVVPPIVLSALVVAWEISVPRSANIRVDLLLTLPLLGLVYGVCGFALLGHAWAAKGDAPELRSSRAGSSLIAGIICVGVTAALAGGWALDSRRIARNIERADKGARLAFEVAFRDDATQRRVFGDIDRGADGWAGYYAREKTDLFPHAILINAAGDYWVFAADGAMHRGRREPSSTGPDAFRGRELAYGALLDGVYSVALERDAQGRLVQVRRDGQKVTQSPFVRQQPPRFPVAAAGPREVTYRGVFSAVNRTTSGQNLVVVQLWIWEAGGKLWGKYLRRGIAGGRENWIGAASMMHIDCGLVSCRKAVLKYRDGGREQSETVTWIDAQTLRFDVNDSSGHEIVLRPGEAIPGFLYDLAPLSSVAENREWLEAMPADVSWTPPALATSAGGPAPASPAARIVPTPPL